MTDATTKSKAFGTLSPRAMQLASALQIICGVILGFDVGAELHMALLYPAALSFTVILHLGLEVLATLFLGWAFILTRQQMRAAKRALEAERNRLHSLRNDFDSFLQHRFSAWGLTQAETDIALLTVRGLKISEIALLRHTRDGTIKSQLSTIFRKSGVRTRTELVASFLDEFLDVSAQPPLEPRQHGGEPS
jgi:DNA-binding CsgD family transcriptional regulator